MRRGRCLQPPPAPPSTRRGGHGAAGSPGPLAGAGRCPRRRWRDVGNAKAATSTGFGICLRCFIPEFFKSCWEGELAGWPGLLTLLLNSFTSFNNARSEAAFLGGVLGRPQSRRNASSTFPYFVNLAPQGGLSVPYADLCARKAENVFLPIKIAPYLINAAPELAVFLESFFLSFFFFLFFLYFCKGGHTGTYTGRLWSLWPWG